jgi:tetratricopeptide (TPR) repeat protein
MGSKLIAAAGAAFLASAFLGLAAPAIAANGPDIITGGSFGGPHVNTSQEVERGRAALAASDYRDAQDAFRRVTELTPNDADAWYDLGQAASGLGETRSAEHAFARSVALDPKSIDSRRELALVLVKSKQADKATAQLDALKAMAASCKDTCAETDELQSAITTVQGALAN